MLSSDTPITYPDFYNFLRTLRKLKISVSRLISSTGQALDVSLVLLILFLSFPGSYFVSPSPQFSCLSLHPNFKSKCNITVIIISVCGSAAAAPGSAPLPRPRHPRPAHATPGGPPAPPAPRGRHCEPAGFVLRPEPPAAAQRREEAPRQQQ